MLNILKEFTELPDNVKLVQLSKLMCSSDDVEKSKKEFQCLLHSLPVDLVSSDHSHHFCFYCFLHFETAYMRALSKWKQFQPNTELYFIFLSIFCQVSSADVRGFGTLLLDATRKNKPDFVRLLLEYRLYSFLMTLPKSLSIACICHLGHIQRCPTFYKPVGGQLYTGMA